MAVLNLMMIIEGRNWLPKTEKLDGQLPTLPTRQLRP